MNSTRNTNGIQDPWAVLDVPVNSSEDILRQAYLDKLRQYPPDRAPEQFERIRDAYEMARTPGMRARSLLKDTSRSRLESVLDDVEDQRAFVGPEPWLAVMKEK